MFEFLNVGTLHLLQVHCSAFLQCWKAELLQAFCQRHTLIGCLAPPHSYWVVEQRHVHSRRSDDAQEFKTAKPFRLNHLSGTAIIIGRSLVSAETLDQLRIRGKAVLGKSEPSLSPSRPSFMQQVCLDSVNAYAKQMQG
jgi:hypothetical protein